MATTIGNIHGRFYSKPFFPIKEVIFKNFQDFFAQSPEKTQWKGAKLSRSGGQVSQKVSKWEKERRKQEKIGHTAQKQKENGVSPDLTLVGGYRIEEEGQGTKKPKKQI